MSNITISVPITKGQERFLEDRVKRGASANKAHAVRQAIDTLAEEQLLQDVLEAEEEIHQGKGVKGDLREILRKMK